MFVQKLKNLSLQNRVVNCFWVSLLTLSKSQYEFMLRGLLLQRQTKQNTPQKNFPRRESLPLYMCFIAHNLSQLNFDP